MKMTPKSFFCLRGPKVIEYYLHVGFHHTNYQLIQILNEIYSSQSILNAQSRPIRTIRHMKTYGSGKGELIQSSFPMKHTEAREAKIASVSCSGLVANV